MEGVVCTRCEGRPIPTSQQHVARHGGYRWLWVQSTSLERRNAIQLRAHKQSYNRLAFLQSAKRLGLKYRRVNFHENFRVVVFYIYTAVLVFEGKNKILRSWSKKGRPHTASSISKSCGTPWRKSSSDCLVSTKLTRFCGSTEPAWGTFSFKRDITAVCEFVAVRKWFN